MNKKILLLIFVGIFLIGIVSSTEISYCCEKTIGGAWCLETNQDNCATGINPETNSPYRKAPTSCESTSYCKTGTCINGQEGTCLPNVPQIRCQEEGGLWNEKPKEEIPQCKLGCCLMIDQAAFVTQTKCKRMSNLYGLETIFKGNVQNELQCIALSFPKEKGACVYEKDYEKTCKQTTRKDCQDMQSNPDYSNFEFHEGYLCSAEELATNCGPSKKTTCVEKEDEVYFLDTCGNLANIYDSEKIDNVEYWTYIKDKDESCNPDNSNTNSKICGNCDSFLSSTCMAYKSGNKPAFGDYICGSLDCENKDFKDKYGRNPKHGEEWCVTNANKPENANLPGTEHFKLSCYDGEVLVENAEPWRAQVCVQGELNNIKTANFRINNWQQCVFQDNQKDCENTEKGDCKWIEGPKKFSVLKDNEGKSLAKDEDGDKTYASCVPKYPPAFNFWETDTEAVQECSKASTTCIVNYEKGLLTGNEWKVKGTKTCLDDKGNIIESWEESMNEICVSMGDCGNSLNQIGKKGYHNGEAVIVGSRKKTGL